jgi:two-component system response regulator (stage 0 sporulation protein A)
MMVNEQKMDNVLLLLGHDDFNRGTAYLREAVRLYEPGMALTKELYPAIARVHSTTGARVERCMRHSIDKAWGRGCQEARTRFFGYSYDPDTGRPQVGEYVARLARLCHEASSL